MTWKQKYATNKTLVAGYLAFLMDVELTYEQKLKLTTEIGRLQLQNQYINTMTVEEFHADCSGALIEIPSRLNGTNT